ncbi:MAG: 1-acyl-sn-glycerol-3-phosphate acyltransferase [Prevotellaceae bacterium]|nr:1-acyl-sn-glycerol-3-phosphate acyltransferase [Prevotellaceae bacterium]
MTKIHEKDRRYRLLRFYVDILFFSAYRRVEFHGKEKVPKDGAIIYAANHTNTLMDALAVLAIDKQEKVFVARADIFKNPIILKFLTFLKMLPINRKRDGIDTLSKNEDVNDIVVDAMQNRVPFCIMPEGTHHNIHNLMSLQKGLFRIALQAYQTFGNQMPIYIVPVGIEFGHYYRYRSSILVQIGTPINVSQSILAHPDLTPPQQMNMLRDALSNNLKEVILHVPDDQNYSATWELSQLYGKKQHQRFIFNKNQLINRFNSVKEKISNVSSLFKTDQKETKHLAQMVNDFSRQRQMCGIGIDSVLKPHIRWSLVGRIVLFLLGLPIFIVSAVATSPVTLLSLFLCTKFKDKAFHNTVRLLTLLVMLPIVMLVGVTLFSIFLSYIWGILFFVLLYPSYIFLHESLRLVRLIISDCKWLANRKLRKLCKKIIYFNTKLII